MMSNDARTTVEHWQAGSHAYRWDEPARSMAPSSVNYLLASAWAIIAKSIDAQADGLAAVGFQPGLPTMRELRELASNAARQSQRAKTWADDLLAAENEIPTQGES